MQLFVHDPDTTSPQIIEIAETVLVRELVVGHDGDLVWLAEVDVPLELDITVSRPASDMVITCTAVRIGKWR